MEYTPRELREMDDDEARQTLTVEQYERRESLLELMEEADETRERIDEQNERVEELVVHADKEQLGTEVDVFGNDLLVHVDSDNDEFREAAERLEALEPDDETEIDTLDDDLREDMAEQLTTMLDAILVRWNGAEWSDLPADARAGVLADAREKWGLDGLMLAWADIAAAVNEDREERVGVVDSFRGEGRGRGR